jgi:cytochrome oxidase Cu insertion factor (SCO1/SenC/PrrC family)
LVAVHLKLDSCYRGKRDAFCRALAVYDINSIDRRSQSSMKNFEGMKAPGFTLPGNDGKKHSLDEFKGKTVVLFFYPKDSTPG